MGFSGGGSNILKPHTHDSNILQDGGNLDMTGVTQGNLSAGSVTYSDGNNLQELAIGTPAQILTVNAGATAPEYTSLSGVETYQALDHHIATGTESTYTYTPGTPLNIQTTYSKIIVFFSGVNTASLAMQVKINGLTNYAYSKLLADTSTVSTALHTAQTTFEVIGTELIDGPSAFFAGDLELWSLQSAGSTNRCMIKSNGWTEHEGQQTSKGDPGTGNTTTITSIEVLTSTSTWQQNTEIWIYGVLR